MIGLIVDKEDLVEFEKLYNEALTRGDKTFDFQGTNMLCDYAKYVIEYYHSTSDYKREQAIRESEVEHEEVNYEPVVTEIIEVINTELARLSLGDKLLFMTSLLSEQQEIMNTLKEEFDNENPE